MFCPVVMVALKKPVISEIHDSEPGLSVGALEIGVGCPVHSAIRVTASINKYLTKFFRHSALFILSVKPKLNSIHLQELESHVI